MIFIHSLTHSRYPSVQRGIRFATINLTPVLLLLMMSACAPTAGPVPEQESPTREFDTVEGEIDDEIPPGTIPSRKPSECPDLDSQLYQLTQADDPVLMAEQLGFRVKDDKLQVLLILTSEDTTFLHEFGVELGTQSGKQVQAFVPFDQLCELANVDQVLAIRPPAQAIP